MCWVVIIYMYEYLVTDSDRVVLLLKMLDYGMVVRVALLTSGNRLIILPSCSSSFFGMSFKPSSQLNSWCWILN